MKVQIFPYKLKSLKMAYSEPVSAYNLSVIDVDYEAEPKEADFHNWINTKKSVYYNSVDFEPMTEYGHDCITYSSRSISRIKMRYDDVMVGVCLIDGSIHQIAAECIKFI